ncbi:RHS repeat domain-containing protein [Streptantibioticus silvisoli]|uniref:RHS repeat-associated core domain-containing protein n=1 Tax=Streptantibioticus silvisoli TaxID=2705255 RepID=A0ABT6W5T9_9ACTN|nr:RHS repeat-associated core domain-containing protein [Streptantibioticus silvisoli]MDI5966117.1 RHS repeat-associated core domain-containing protein [Streptantibioticus silvisoli]
MTWTTSYDLLGDIYSATDPDTGTTTTAYDDDAEVTGTTDQDQHQLTYDYDPLGRKTDEYKGTTSGTKIASWSYDPTGAKGYPASAIAYDQTSGKQTYSSTVAGYTTDYQPTGTTVTIPSDAYGNTSDITYSTADTYTPVQDQLLKSAISTTGAGGLMPDETLTYGYDDPGLPVTLGGAAKYNAWIDYTPLGQTLRATMGDTPDQVVSTNSWEQATGRLLNYSLDKEDGTSAVDSIDYTYDPSGHLTSTDDVQDAGGTANTDLQCYTYDYLSRLTNVWTDDGGTTTKPAPSINGVGSCTNTAPDPSNISGAGPAPYWQSYGYDLTGNRLSKTDHSLTPGVTPDVTTGEVYDTAGHTHAVHTTTTGNSTQTYTYDGDGNPLTVGATQNGTDQPDQDQTLTWNATGQLNTLAAGSHTSSYGYDPDGNLIARTDDGTTTLFLGSDQITLNSSGSTTSVVRAYSLPGAPTVLRTATAGRTGSTLDYQSANPQGTATTDITAGNLTVTHREYTPFGEDRGTAPANWPGDKGFVGGTVDDTTGLTNLGAREYDPSLGRFITPDSLQNIGDPQQWNGYAYSNNDPVDGNDRTGRIWIRNGDGDPVADATSQGAVSENKSSGTARGKYIDRLPAEYSDCNNCDAGVYVGSGGESRTDVDASGAAAVRRTIVKTSRTSIGPYRMGGLWALGVGQYVPKMYFGPGDTFTKELQNDPHNQALLQQCEESPTLCTAVGTTAVEDYEDHGIANLLSDGLAVLSHGSFGRPPVDAFLGSYAETLKVRSYDPVSAEATVDFKVTNKSGWNSFFHFISNGIPNTHHGLGATIEEDFTWSRTVHVTG